MICPRCGAYMSDDATFCPQCGMAVPAGQNINNMTNGGNMPPNTPPQNNNNKGLIILLCGIAAAVLFVAVAIITFLVMSGDSPFGAKETPSPAPTEPPQVTAAPAQPTPQIVYVPQTNTETGNTDAGVHDAAPPRQQESGYKTYYSDRYDFACDYPASFTTYDDHGTLTLYTVRSADWSGTEKIVAKPNEGETVSSSAADFLASHPGVVTYEAVGDDYYAYTIRSGDTEYYKYCKFAKGNLYWFEFSYPSAQHDAYDVHINAVYNSFSY